MQRARLALTVAGTAMVVLSLSACEKPNPGASVFSGTTSAYQQALCWAPEGAYLDEKTCANDLIDKASKGASSVSALPGQTIGISVDPVVADIGWYPVLGGQRVTATPVTDTYFRFTPDAAQLGAGNGALAIVAGDEGGTRGIWMYRLATS